MAQQTEADDEAQNGNSPDPELAANTLAQAADSLKVYLGRDAMREFGREHGSRSSGTKQEMAESMLAEAQEQALALLVEEGVELGGELAVYVGEDEDEQEDEDEDTGRTRTTVGEMLARDPAEYHRDDSLGYSEKQVGLLAHAMQHPDSTDEDVAEAVDCSARYANSVCHRWDASEDGVEALEDAGHEVPEQFQEVGA